LKAEKQWRTISTRNNQWRYWRIATTN